MSQSPQFDPLYCTVAVGAGLRNHFINRPSQETHFMSFAAMPILPAKSFRIHTYENRVNLTKRSGLTPLESILTCHPPLNPFRIHTYVKQGVGGAISNFLSHFDSFEGFGGPR